MSFRPQKYLEKFKEYTSGKQCGKSLWKGTLGYKRDFEVKSLAWITDNSALNLLSECADSPFNLPVGEDDQRDAACDCAFSEDI